MVIYWQYLLSETYINDMCHLWNRWHDLINGCISVGNREISLLRTKAMSPMCPLFRDSNVVRIIRFENINLFIQNQYCGIINVEVFSKLQLTNGLR